MALQPARVLLQLLPSGQVAGRPLHSALSRGTFRSTGGLTAGKQILSVTVHQGVLLSVTAVSALVNPYTMEGWSRCAFFSILP